MADDWKPGDAALCANAKPCPVFKEPSGLTEGHVYIVAHVKTGACKTTGLVATGLWLVGQTVGRWHRETRFVKQRPHTPDAEDAETIRLLTGKPAKQPAYPTKGGSPDV